MYHGLAYNPFVLTYTRDLVPPYIIASSPSLLSPSQH